MANGDTHIRIKRDIKDKLKELKFTMRKETYPEVLESIILFCEKNKERLEKWAKKK